MSEETRPSIKKVLFYTNIPRAFRATLVGYVYEVSQKYPTILLSEKLDTETEEILSNKELFPLLEEIVPVCQFGVVSENIFAKNKRLCQLAKEVIERYGPDIVISPSDTHSLFELYLMRFAKRVNAVTMAVQTANALDSNVVRKWVNLINAYSRSPSFLPLWLRLLFVKARRYGGHFFYYWILPIIVKEKPFFGKSSHILRIGNSGMRDADYQIIFSQKDYNVYLNDGVPKEKLYILPHPLKRKSREFFEEAYLYADIKKIVTREKTVHLLWPSDAVGFRRVDSSLISERETKETKIKIVKEAARIMNEWQIIITFHPDTVEAETIKEELEKISNVTVIKPKEPVDKYLEVADAIIGLPLSVSTALFTAFLLHPEKPIISLDINQEIMGDYYKDFEGIECIDDEDKLIDVLKSIQNNTYCKSFNQTEGQFEEKEYSNSIEIIEFLFNKKNENH
ncbi:MAG: hypothetical protein V1905_02080 [bacterium]